MTPWQYLVACASVFIASAIQGTLGMGFAFVLVPVLGAMAPATVPATIICLGLPLMALMAIRERSEIDVGGLRWLLPGWVVGTALGVATLVAVRRSTLQVVFGGAVMLGATLVAIGPRIPMRAHTQLGAGTLSGLMATTAALGGPPLGVLYSARPAAELRSTLAITLGVGTVLSLTGLRFAGELQMAHATTALWLAPAMVVGLRISGPLARHLPERAVRHSVLAFAATAGLVMALRA